MLIVLTGPASSGKDTVILKLLERFPNLKRIVTTTSRPQRAGEVDGKDYHFVPREKFEQMIKDGKFLEYVDFFGNSYGTEKEALNPLFEGQDLIWRVETSRAANVKEVLPHKFWDKTIVIYIDVPDWRVLKERMRKRDVSEEQIQQRLKKDKKDFQKYGSGFENIIYNEEGKLEETMNQIITLIKL